MRLAGSTILIPHAILAGALSAGEVVVPYSCFGPPSLAHELIGMDWWQWNPHGDSEPGAADSIQVVVYWDQTLGETMKRYPVIPAKRQDFRYVDYLTAASFMEEAVKELKEMESRDAIGSLVELRKKIEKSLTALQTAYGKSGKEKLNQ